MHLHQVAIAAHRLTLEIDEGNKSLAAAVYAVCNLHCIIWVNLIEHKLRMPDPISIEQSFGFVAIGAISGADH